MTRILVVEDDSMIALDVEAILRESKFTVVVATSIETALSALKDFGFDGAVLDGLLHGRWAEPVARELERKHIPYIVCSGNSPDELSWANPVRYVQKPFTALQISTAVHAALESVAHRE